MRLSPWLRRTAPALRPATFRPCLEGLDDRSLPSAVGFSTALTYSATAMAVDPAGNVAVSTGYAVYRFSPSGQLLASKTSVPGEGGGIAVDAAGDVYLNNKGVITELDPTLQQTLFTVTIPGVVATGNLGTMANGAIAVSGGKVYAVGTAGAGLPTTPTAYQAAFPGAATGLLAAYVAVIDPSSSAPYHLTYCTYLGGTTVVSTMPAGGFANAHGAAASGVAVNSAGAVYLTGITDATNFPTTAGAFQTVNRARFDSSIGYGGWTSFVTKVDPSQSGAASLVYSTFLGGSGYDGYVVDAPARYTQSSAPAIAVDAAGDAYVTGSTTSVDFPVTAGAFQTTYTPIVTAPTANYRFGHAYVTKLSPDGGHLVFSTLLSGGSGGDWGGGIAVDAAGNVWVTGGTRSSNFPVTPGALQPQKASGKDGYNLPIANAFVIELDPTGSTEIYGTYWGGTADAFGMGIGLDGFGNVIVVGQLLGGGTYPTTTGVYQTSGGGFILKFHP